MAKIRTRKSKEEDHRNQDDHQATQQCIRTGLFVRSLALARLAFTTSGDFWSLQGGILGAEREYPPEQRLRLQAKLEEQAREVTKELGALKGSVMKVGQLLSMYGEHFLPPQVNTILKSLQASAPPLDWKTIEPFIRKELGNKFDELEINPTAIAAASIGQVHAAKIKATGETIALKVQYPGVDRAIATDLKALKTIVLLAPGIPRGKRMNELICEIEEMLWREVDYTFEADCAEKFAEHLKDDPRFMVPKVRREWCTSKILAIEMICGHRLDDHGLQALPQERRNAIADSLLDLYLRELFDFGCVQTDPHIGNYRIRLAGEMTCDGRMIDRDCVVLLDFGAVRRFESAFLTNYRCLVKSTLEQRREAVVQAGLDLGFLLPCDPQILNEAFYGFCRLVVEPFDPLGASPAGREYFDADGSYNWCENNLPNRLAAQLTEVIRARELRVPPREAIFLDRKSSGLYILLRTLGAKTKAHQKLADILQRQ